MRSQKLPALLRSRAGNRDRGRDLPLPFRRSVPVPSRCPLSEDAGLLRQVPVHPAGDADGGPSPPTGMPVRVPVPQPLPALPRGMPVPVSAPQPVPIVVPRVFPALPGGCRCQSLSPGCSLPSPGDADAGTGASASPCPPTGDAGTCTPACPGAGPRIRAPGAAPAVSPRSFNIPARQ